MKNVEGMYPHEKKCFDGYSKQATYYDGARFEDFSGRLRKEAVFRLIDNELKSLNTEKPSILDVATGTGVCALYLAETRKSATVQGIDLTENMLNEARRKANALKLINVSFKEANARELPFPNNSFDAVISLRFFHHIPNDCRRMYLLEMFRVLKPGGILILEFKNYFYGGIVGLIKHYILRNPGGHYLYPSQIPALFKGIKIKRIVGLYLPLLQWVARINREAVFNILKLARRFPLNFLSSDSYIICVK